jgi:tRNA A-37 threonylcarbamoyl transferase component Bud32
MTPQAPDERDLVDRLVDGEPIDWDHASASDRNILDALHTLDQVRNAYQRIGATAAPHKPPLFQWGPLAVLEKVASGASAEVYRAWDAGLATVVALKLLRPEAAAAGLRNDEFLHEGRLLARLSQRNVLRVHGAAVHDGRPGIWNEWIEGRTLDAIVAADGPFAGAEAAHIGIELCAALAAIHAAGLLHGDVKASNVLRARGGRIVLVDLGAAGAPDTLNSSLRTQATPAYLSPQSRDGAPRAVVDDLYALGVLLHFLLSGEYPEDGRSRLRALKPEIDPRIAATVEHALSPEPQRRFASAHAFGDALRDDLGHNGSRAGTTVRRGRTRQWTIAALVAAVALAIGIVAWPSRALPWRAQVELMRRTDRGNEVLRDGAKLHLGDRIDLKLATDRPTWVYVVNEDAAGEFHVLFPLAGLELANPIGTGSDITLPGAQAGRSLSWEVSGTGGGEEFVVLLARAPLARLERNLAALPVAAIERGVRHATANLPAAVQLRGKHLKALLSGSSAELGDAARVQVRAWHFDQVPRG